MKLFLMILVAFVAGVATYLVLAPTEHAPVAWQAPPPPPASGIYTPNSQLDLVERFGRVGLEGPEYVLPDGKGHIYAGFKGGKIMAFAINADDSISGEPAREVADTHGRPLGMRLLKNGDLIVADAEVGLLRVHPEGSVQVLVHELGGTTLGLLDDVELSADERFAYFTEASRKYRLEDSVLDIVEHGAHGRLLRQDLVTGETTVLQSGLNFANGLALGPEGAYLLMNETGNYRVLRYWLRGDKAGTVDVFADNLPGFPDNVTFNGKDRIWVALVDPRNPLVDKFASYPLVRKALMALPAFLRPKPNHAAQAIAFDLTGRPVVFLQGHGGGSYAPVTTVREQDGWLYLGSLTQDSLARVRWAAH